MKHITIIHPYFIHMRLFLHITFQVFVISYLKVSLYQTDYRFRELSFE